MTEQGAGNAERSSPVLVSASLMVLPRTLRSFSAFSALQDPEKDLKSKSIFKAQRPRRKAAEYAEHQPAEERSRGEERLAEPELRSETAGKGSRPPKVCSRRSTLSEMMPSTSQAPNWSMARLVFTVHTTSLHPASWIECTSFR